MASRILTDELIQRFAERIAAGCDFAEAARKVGVKRNTAFWWLKQGKERPGTDYEKFATAIDEAKGKAVDKRTPENRAVKLTLAVTQEICDRIANGKCSLADAAVRSGISERTFHVWMANGSEEDAEPMYRNFFERVEAAKAQAKEVMLERMFGYAGLDPDNKEGAPSKISKVVRTGPSGTITEKRIIQEPALWNWRILQARYPEEFASRRVVDSTVKHQGSSDVRVTLVHPGGEQELLEDDDADE